jgi:hypothetical protein
VMQPHNLVGVLQPRGVPVRISSHWRLGSLHAWLTLQLRYLAFHGPARLVVQGCRGVRVEPADAGRAISQAATIGFNANLGYSTRRCETFIAYLRGKQALLNDSFAGGPGFYVYDELPHTRKHPGGPGRWLEGFADSVHKVFGIEVSQPLSRFAPSLVWAAPVSYAAGGAQRHVYDKSSSRIQAPFPTARPGNGSAHASDDIASSTCLAEAPHSQTG